MLYCLICNKNDMLIPFNKFHFNCVEKEIIFLHELIIFIFYQLTSLDNITVTFISLGHISSQAFWGKRDIFLAMREQIK